MADYLSRACRLQLTTAMENLIRTAVFEISQIFEDSLHDHQVELARKGEEIAYLKIKLQRAELRIKDASTCSGADMSLNQSFESPTTFEAPAPDESAPLQSSPAPEEDFEFEVPDDWCVPLESENVSKPENPCPSVRLRQFSIPLYPIPLKHEAFSRLEVSRLRRRHNKDTVQTESQGEIKPKRRPGRPRVVRPEQVKNLAMKIKEEPVDISVQPFKRGPGRPKEPKHMDATQAKIYACKFCPKVFDKPFALSVHERAHKKCKGCKRIFAFPSFLEQHKPHCKHLKNRLMPSTVPVSPKETISKENSQSIEEKNKSLSPKIKLFGRKRNRFTCKSCQKNFENRSSLVNHPCFVTCRICHKKLSNSLAIALHMSKVHNSQANISEDKMDTSWTKPLVKMEKTDETQQESHYALERAKNQIKQCPLGYKCRICKRVYTSKYTAIEHTFLHTGEKPFKCALCSQTFSQRNMLSVHRRKSHGVVMRKVMKCACSKRFYDKSKYKEHKSSCPKAGKREKS